jgi:GntR family transcriptional regulator, rspAB operon transcriptional repressor
MNNTVLTIDFQTDLKPSARGGAVSRVHGVLREQIVSLQLKPGQMLDKQALADQFGVSRAPVYEAFTKLQSEALLDVFPQRGTFVALIRLSDTRENMFLRRSIEVAAVRQLAPTISPRVLAELDRNLAYQAAAIAAEDRPGFYRFDLEFHAHLLNALGFPRVRQVAETARLGLERVRRLLSSRRRLEDTLLEHHTIVAALRSGDSDAAAKTIADHLQAVLRELETFAQASPELFADLQEDTAS